jgi:6-phosphofructokinase
VAPCAFDQEYTRELGAGAVETLLGGQGHVMITRQNGKIVPIPFDELIDPKTGKTAVRMLDTATEGFSTAMRLQTRLEAADLADPRTGKQIESVTALDLAALQARFG